MTTSQKASLGTTDHQPTNSDKGPWNSREMQLNERIVNKTKRAYYNKYRLDQINVYEKAFSELNRRIFTEVQNQKRGCHLPSKSQSSLKMDDYSRLYRKNSQDVIKLIQKHGVNESSGAEKHNMLLREVKRLEVSKPETMQKGQESPSNKTLPKIYDYDETVKFKMSYRKNMPRLNTQSLQLTKKLNASAGQDVFTSLPHYQPREYGPGAFSKNAYLASLNIVFRNLIV